MFLGGGGFGRRRINLREKKRDPKNARGDYIEEAANGGRGGTSGVRSRDRDAG